MAGSFATLKETNPTSLQSWSVQKFRKSDPARIRTWNPLIRSQVPYPLGHRAFAGVTLSLDIACMSQSGRRADSLVLLCYIKNALVQVTCSSVCFSVGVQMSQSQVSQSQLLPLGTSAAQPSGEDDLPGNNCKCACACSTARLKANVCHGARTSLQLQCMVYDSPHKIVHGNRSVNRMDLSCMRLVSQNKSVRCAMCQPPQRMHKV